jgi:hypothetical protein
MKTEKTAHAQNNTFASPDTQTDTSACKRVVFLPTHLPVDNFVEKIEENNLENNLILTNFVKTNNVNKQ